MSLSNEDKQWLTETFLVKPESDRSASKQDLIDMETKLLTEFHKWAVPNEQRQRAHAGDIRALEVEVEALQDR